MPKLIHPPYLKFKGWLRANNITYAELGEFLGINESTVSQKINGQSDFYLSEIQAVKHRWELDSDIFFTNLVA